MALKDHKQIILDKMLTEVELPESAYEKAIKRYEDIGEWFSREESSLQKFDPHVFPQGSFRMGTAIKPVGDGDTYDLDLSCKLRLGISKNTHTQEELKRLVGNELEAYRKARRIETPLVPKHRCWRLEYKDDLNFHIDIIPCIPEEESGRRLIKSEITKSGMDELIANSASETTVVITDDRHSHFRSISLDWKISNPEGYAAWFEDQMRRKTFLNMMEKAQVDDVPIYKRKNPLQKAVQLLKRHRDLMFKGDDDAKPISIIITTLAARAYNGEQDLSVALKNILEKMGELVNPSTPRVPNPVHPAEDFADRWGMQKYKHLNLEGNFWNWLTQAKSDFEQVTGSEDVKFVAGQANRKLGVILNEVDLAKSLGLGASASPRTPHVQIIRESEASKPWRAKP